MNVCVCGEDEWWCGSLCMCVCVWCVCVYVCMCLRECVCMCEMREQQTPWVRVAALGAAEVWL